LPKIVELVENNPVVLIVAPTGSGKSVGVPRVMKGICFVVVPTRSAAISLYEYQKKLGHESVGYAAEGNIKYDSSTALVYVTGGHMRLKMLSFFRDGTARDVDFCDVLIVDEIHSGSIDNTLIISLWMAASNREVLVP